MKVLKETGFVLLVILCMAGCRPAGSVKVTVGEGTNMAAALSPDNKTIAISLQGGIWILPAAGGEAVRITDEFADAQEPSWSPDGEHIAFHSYRDGNYHIWTIRKDGKQLMQHTFGFFDDREPSWSPDGKSLVFSSDRSGNYDIWKVTLPGNSLTQLTTNGANDSNPAWSSDGSMIAFISDRKEEPGIYLWKDGMEKLFHQSALRVTAPSWAKDDRQIFFTEYLGRTMLFDDHNTSIVYAKSISGDSLVRVSGGEEDVFPFRVGFFDDGAILYAADGKIKKRWPGNDKVELIPLSATFQLERPAYERKKYDFDKNGEQKALGIIGPVISPDGKRIAFAAMGNLYVQEIGGVLKKITDDQFVDLDPDWSPDGNQLAFTTDRNGLMQVWIYDFATSEARLLTDRLTGEMSFPSWSPNGTQIAFYLTDYRKRWGAGILHIAEVASGKVTPLSKGVAVPGKPSWSPDSKIIAIAAQKAHSTRFREGYNQFLLINTEDGETRWMTPDSSSSLSVRGENGPAWSPDGNWIAYVNKGLLYTIPVDKSGTITGAPVVRSSELADNISWTRDSKSISYLATDRLKKLSIANNEVTEIILDLRWKQNIPGDRYIVHAGRLITGVDSSYKSDVDIYIEANRIKKFGSPANREPGISVIEASDKVVMPGLFEMHTHQSTGTGERLGKIWLSYGITSVREPGSDPYEALERKEAWSSGIRPGPREFYTGPLMDGNRIAYGLAATVTDRRHVRQELERARILDYDLIKTYVRMPDSVQKELTKGAHELGIPTSSHELYPAIGYGVDAIEHLSGTSRRGYSMLLDGSFRSYDDVIQLIAQSGANITPTLCLRTGFYRMVKQYDELLDDARIRKFISPDVMKAQLEQAERYDSTKTTRSDQNYRALLKTIKSIVDAGGKVTAGTDAPFALLGTSLHSELWILVDAGLTPYQALRAGSLNAAQAIGVDKDLGSIEVGKLADLVIVEGSPLERIQDAMKVKKVIKNGIVYDVEQWLGQ